MNQQPEAPLSTDGKPQEFYCRVVMDPTFPTIPGAIRELIAGWKERRNARKSQSPKQPV